MPTAITSKPFFTITPTGIQPCQKAEHHPIDDIALKAIHSHVNTEYVPSILQQFSRAFGGITIPKRVHQLKFFFQHFANYSSTRDKLIHKLTTNIEYTHQSYKTIAKEAVNPHIDPNGVTPILRAFSKKFGGRTNFLRRIWFFFAHHTTYESTIKKLIERLPKKIDETTLTPIPKQIFAKQAPIKPHTPRSHSDITSPLIPPAMPEGPTRSVPTPTAFFQQTEVSNDYQPTSSQEHHTEVQLGSPSKRPKDHATKRGETSQQPAQLSPPTFASARAQLWAAPSPLPATDHLPPSPVDLAPEAPPFITQLPVEEAAASPAPFTQPHPVQPRYQQTHSITPHSDATFEVSSRMATDHRTLPPSEFHKPTQTMPLNISSAPSDSTILPTPQQQISRKTHRTLPPDSPIAPQRPLPPRALHQPQTRFPQATPATPTRVNYRPTDTISPPHQPPELEELRRRSDHPPTPPSEFHEPTSFLITKEEQEKLISSLNAVYRDDPSGKNRFFDLVHKEDFSTYTKILDPVRRIETIRKDKQALEYLKKTLAVQNTPGQLKSERVQEILNHLEREGLKQFLQTAAIFPVSPGMLPEDQEIIHRWMEEQFLSQHQILMTEQPLHVDFAQIEALRAKPYIQGTIAKFLVEYWIRAKEIGKPCLFDESVTHFIKETYNRLDLTRQIPKDFPT